MISIVNKYCTTNMSLTNQLFIISFCILANATEYTTDELFAKFDINNDGIVTREEIEISAKHMNNIKINKDECSCFKCDGSLYKSAVVCDVYDNSGCGNDVGERAMISKHKCYTTNYKKCKCNLYSKNPYVCKIPLTYSFLNYKEKEMNYYVKIDNNTKHISSPKKTYDDDMWERSGSAYQKGRNSAINDMVDFAATYVLVDTVSTMMVDSLVDKDI